MTTGITNCLCLRLLQSLALLAIVHSVQASDSPGRAIGEAYDLHTGKLLYRETYCSNGSPDELEVFYRSHEGQLIARKLLDYSSGLVTPSFVQHNLHTSEVIEVELHQDRLTMSVSDAGNAAPKKIKSSQPGDRIPIVIDAGLDGFVRGNWDSLLAGETKRFLYPFAERSRLVKLRIKPSACFYQTETDQCFRLELSNWFLRMLIAPIELGYDPEMRRLKRYRGLSNIGDENGSSLRVDIRYNYHKIPELACRASDQALADGIGIQELALFSRWQTGVLGQ